MTVPREVRPFLGSPLVRALELLDVCGEECEGLHVSSPMWRLLAPGEMFARAHPRVYRAHVRELLGRYVADEALDTATAAELLLGLVETSQAVPLNRDGQALYHALFRRVMGAETHRQLLDGVEPPPERWPGQVAEMEASARRQLRTGRPKRVE